MLCQKCQQKEANVHFKININGNKKNLHLCKQCYEIEQKKMTPTLKPTFIKHSPFSSLYFDDFLKGMGFSQQSQSKPFVEQNIPNRSGGFLDQYGRNLTQLAKAGLIDPVIGRDKEINRVIEILNRRNKNNPVLIGEPGVGKTAIAEHLATRIVEGKVPNKLKNKEVILLDVATLVSGTGIRGQFEERMKQIIGELKERKNIILFIDEIHLIVGAGSAEGALDAGNILKPALARGELQLIGATTLKEYRQIEKDGALERRFQPVLVEEPTTDETIKILQGLKKKYEDFHEVIYTDEAIEACVTLSKRYIQDRFLPDRAIDLMDEAGAKKNLSAHNQSTEQMEKRLEEISLEKKRLVNEEKYEEAAKLREEEKELEKLLNQSLDNTERRPKVVKEDIQKIIEQKTGIPVGKLQEDQQLRIKYLYENLSKKVIGQEEAVQKVAKAIRRSRAGLKAKNRPIGSFLFVGPTGVGKTELSKALAYELFGSKEAMIRLDMSEYMEKHSVSKLIGSPPGYVGHEEAGQLTEKVRRNPYSIVLVDEVEKAHPDVLHIFLQILDDGRLTDSQGRVVNFTNTVIIMTSNAGASEKENQVGFNQSVSVDKLELNLVSKLSNYFKLEFLNRFDNIIEFKPLEKQHLLKIVDLMLEDIYEMLKEQQITLEVTDEVKGKLVEKGFNRQFGARPLRRVIQQQLEDPIADFILEHENCKHLRATLENDEIKVVHQK